MLSDLISFFKGGGWVMYPLLLLSLVSITLSVERAAFWARTHSPAARRKLSRLMGKIRAGETTAAIATAEQSGSIYMRFVAGLLDHATRTNADTSATENAAIELIEDARPIIERFSVVLSTIVTAAPLLGILGTVTGIIQSFRLLGGAETVTDPAAVAAGIAQALYTTAFGLIVALVTLFPYVIFRSQADRCLGRLESVGATIAEHTPRREAPPARASSAA